MGADGTRGTPDDQQPPLLRVVRGEPTPEELAALLVVLAARSSTAGRRPRRSRSEWGHPARLVRTPVHPGPGAWRGSARPG